MPHVAMKGCLELPPSIRRIYFEAKSFRDRLPGSDIAALSSAAGCTGNNAGRKRS
jgi:hypothetical protein